MMRPLARNTEIRDEFLHGSQKDADAGGHEAKRDLEQTGHLPVTRPIH